MLPLPQTKYPNVQRTVSGTVDVFADDVVLNCDTSTGAVTINLGEIPFNATTGVGNWSTQYVLYVNDISNNAGTNSITLVAGGTQTINNQATLVLNTNGASVMVMISGNGKYIVLNAPSSAPSGFITVTYAQLTALIAGDDIIPNGDYLLLDAEFGTAPFMTPTNVFLKGITLKDTANVNSQAIFYNADYQAVGNYSGITGFGAQLGVWTPALVPVLNDVCIWNNRHYKNLTGANGATNPTLDNVNWLELPIQLANGYISVVDSVTYNITTNQITYRKDKLENEVEKTVVGTDDSLNLFPWGNANVKQNKVFSKSIFNICNNITLTPNDSIYNNILNQSVVNIGLVNNPSSISAFGNNIIKSSSGTIECNTVTSFQNNTFESSGFNFITNLNTFELNKVYTSSVDVDDLSGDFINNVIRESVVNLSVNSGLFQLNEITSSTVRGDNLGTFRENFITKTVFNADFLNNTTGFFEYNRFSNLRTFSVVSNTGQISSNIVEFGVFNVSISNQGSITGNKLNNSTFNINSNVSNASVDYNYLDSGSLVIGTNRGLITFNEISLQSAVNLQIVATSILFSFNTVTGSSTVQVATLNGNFGVASKGKGNFILNTSYIEINQMSPLSRFCSNQISATEIRIVLFTGSMFENNIKNCYINSTDLNNKIIEESTLDSVGFGGVSPTIPFPISIMKQTAMTGNCTVLFELDCADPSIYDLPTTTLTIPSTLAFMGGIYLLKNAGGLTISKIVGVVDYWRTSFKIDAGAVNFTSTAIGLATGGDIVSPIGAGTYTLTFHATGGEDLLVVQLSAGLVAVREANILL